MFVLLYFMAFGNLDFLNLSCGAFIFNVYKKSNTLEILTKIKEDIFAEENFAEFSFAF